MLINEISESIYKFLMIDDNPFKSSCLGGLHFIENTKDSKDVVYPFFTYQFIGGTKDKDSADTWEKPIIQFTGYDEAGRSANRLNSVYEKLNDRLDQNEDLLTMASYHVLSIDALALPRNNKTLLGRNQISRDYQLWLERK